MKSYNAEPMYRPQVLMENTIEALGEVRKVKTIREDTDVVLSFQKANGDEVFRASLPIYKTGEPGMLGGEIADDILRALRELEDHINDTDRHLNDNEREELHTGGTIEDLHVTFDDEVHAGDSAENHKMISGDTLQDLMSDIWWWLYDYNKHKNTSHPTDSTIARVAEEVVEDIAAPKEHEHTHDDITDFTEAVQAVVGESTGEITSETKDGWTCLTMPGGHTICTKTFDVTVAIDSAIRNTYYEYCKVLMLGNYMLPYTFQNIPQLYLGVQHLDLVTDVTQGTGVWAVACGLGTVTTLPNIRLQCASTVAKRRYRLCVRVEGMKQRDGGG